MLEKRGRKAAQHALSELANQRISRPATAPAASGAKDKRRSTRQSKSSVARQTHGGKDRKFVGKVIDSSVSGSGVDSPRERRGEEGNGLREGALGGGSGDGGEDAVWLREAEALLAVSSSPDRGH